MEGAFTWRSRRSARLRDPPLVPHGVSVNNYGPNVAVTLRSPVMFTVQVLTRMPEQAPSQRTKTDPNAGLAVRVTTVPLL